MMNKSDPDLEDRIEERRKQIQARIRASIGDRCVVIYAASPRGEDGLPIDNLDQVAIRGRVRAEDEILDSYVG